MADVWPLTGVGADTDWSFTGGGFFNSLDTSVAVNGDGISPPSATDTAALTGSALAAFDAAVADSASCTVTLTGSTSASSAGNDGALQISIRGGTWTDIPIPWSGGAWSAPATAIIVAGVGSGFEVRGNGGDALDFIAFTNVSVEPGGGTTISVSSASLFYQPWPVRVDAMTVKPVVAAAMAYAGRAIAVSAGKRVAVVAAAMPYAGRAIAVNAKTAKSVVAGAMAYAGAAVTVNAGRRVAVAAAAMAYAGAAVTVNAMTRVPVVAGAIAYAGQATRIAQRIAAGVGQIFYYGQIVIAASVASAIAAGGQRLRLGGGFR